jgi:hypothetical protein
MTSCCASAVQGGVTGHDIIWLHAVSLPSRLPLPLSLVGIEKQRDKRSPSKSLALSHAISLDVLYCRVSAPPPDRAVIWSPPFA